jgi:cytochrome c553
MNIHLALVLSAAVGALIIAGCASTAPRSTEREAKSERGGAQLWAATCTQCHYARDPGYFTDAQWEVIMLHMRVRANLTAREHHAILEFLKSAN